MRMAPSEQPVHDNSGRTDASGRSRPIGPETTDPGPDEVVLCVRKALYAFRRGQQWKALILFSIYFGAYLAYVNLIIDWGRGGETVQLFRTARGLLPGINAELDPWCDKNTQMSNHSGQECWWFYKHMQTVHDLEIFLRFGLDKFPATLHQICPSCLVAISTERDNIYGAPLDSYTCADMNRQMVPRDCDQVDAEWAENPSVLAPPCCSHNSSLVAAALSLKTWYSGGRRSSLVESADNFTLGSLLDPVNKEEVSRLAKEYIAEHISTTGHFLHLLIFNGFGRGVGFHYQAVWADDDDEEWSKRSKEKMWAHRLVKTGRSFWSRRLDATTLERFLLVLCWLGSGGSSIHSLIEAWSVSLSREQWREWLGSVRTCLAFVTVLFPILAITGLERHVHPVLWVIIVVITELIMLLRFILEGEVIPGCRILIKTIFFAAGQLATLSIVLVIILMVTATLYGQLFGVFMFPGVEDAYYGVLDEFGNGAKLREQPELYNPVGSKLMYLVTMFVLFLTLSQVFITVLMSGYETARKVTREVDVLSGEPEDYVPVEQQFSSWQRLLNLVVSGLTYWLPLHGTTVPQVVRALMLAIWELEEAYPDLKGSVLGVSQKHLGKCLSEVGAGSTALDVLMAQFGAVRRTVPTRMPGSNLAGTPQMLTEAVPWDQALELELTALKRELLGAFRATSLASTEGLHKSRAVL